MGYETYVLLDELNVSVPIFQRVNKDQRVPIVKRAGYAPFLQVTVQDKNGVTKNLRYKEGCPSVDADEQLEKYKIPANAKYTNSERNDRFFKNGVCITNKVNLQNYLKVYPGFKDSPYNSDEVPIKEYMIYDKANLSKIQNAEARKRVMAANKVLGLSIDEARSMLIRLNGSFFETPNTGDDETDLEECQNMLMEFVDATEDKGLDAVLKEDTTIDEETTILIGKLINAGSLSFDAIDGKVSKKSIEGKWIELRDFSTEYSLEERKRLFSNFLNTSDGKPLKNDLEKDLKGLSSNDLQDIAEKMQVDKPDLEQHSFQPSETNEVNTVKRPYNKKKSKKKSSKPKKYSGEKIEETSDINVEN